MMMVDLDRFAVISDIHGNIDALSAVLSDIERMGIDQILNLGDHLSGPLAAGETADLLLCHDMLSISGNHDRMLVETPPREQSGSEAAAWPQMTAAHLDWLRRLPATRIEGDVLMCHGTPDDDTAYLLERVTSAGDVVLDNPKAIMDRIGTHRCSLILCGHTHVARRIDLPDGPTVLNPGSVGCPGYFSAIPLPHRVQSGTPCASYAILQRRGAIWHSEIRAVAYDSERMAALARVSIRPTWENILRTGWLADS